MFPDAVGGSTGEEVEDNVFLCLLFLGDFLDVEAAAAVVGEAAVGEAAADAFTIALPEIEEGESLKERRYPVGGEACFFLFLGEEDVRAGET